VPMVIAPAHEESPAIISTVVAVVGTVVSIVRPGVGIVAAVGSVAARRNHGAAV
jgi:hypothetical protein